MKSTITGRKDGGFRGIKKIFATHQLFGVLESGFLEPQTRFLQKNTLDT